jgi:transposase
VDRYPSNLPTESQSFCRVEVLSGPLRRRRWSEEEKAAIVAESFAPGAVARRVALRRGVHPNQLYAWRRRLASACVLDRDDGAVASFVPVTVASAGAEAIGGGTVEIAVGGALVRVAPGVDMGFLSAVLRAVKSA